MSIAPSEKHLEDWVVTHPNWVGDYMEWDEDSFNFPGHEAFRRGNTFVLAYIDEIIERQIRLPSGVCDFIILNISQFERSLCAVEIKKGNLDTHALAQCLRYMSDLRRLFYIYRSDNWKELPHYREVGLWGYENGAIPEVSGLLIGNSISDPNILIACEASNIQVLLYDFNNNTYTFTAAEKSDSHRHYSAFREMCSGRLSRALNRVILDRHKQERHSLGGEQ